MSRVGATTQAKVFAEVNARLESIEPGITKNLRIGPDQ